MVAEINLVSTDECKSWVKITGYVCNHRSFKKLFFNLFSRFLDKILNKKKKFCKRLIINIINFEKLSDFLRYDDNGGD